VSGSDVYVGGAFTGAGSVPHDDSIARWDGGAVASRRRWRS
jgi:hypothetical protein